MPVLFRLPPWLVPLTVAAALALARAPDAIQGRAVWSRRPPARRRQVAIPDEIVKARGAGGAAVAELAACAGS